MLSALRSLPDETIAAIGERMDWMAPVSDISRWKEHPNSGWQRASIALTSPICDLLRFRDPRLCSLLLRPDMLGDRLVFEGRTEMEGGSQRYGTWEQAFCEAFALADIQSAQSIAKWQPSLTASDWGFLWDRQGPIFSMAASQADAPKESWAAMLAFAEELLLATPLPKIFGAKTRTKKQRDDFGLLLSSWLLPKATEAGNIPLCEALLERGAQPGRKALLGALDSFSDSIFWRLLGLARNNPAAGEASDLLCTIGDAYRGPYRNDSAQALALVEIVGAELSSGIQRAARARENNPASAPQFHGLSASIVAFAVGCLADGLAEPSLVAPSAELLKINRKTLIEKLSPVADALGPEWTRALSRHEPCPSPTEMARYLSFGQPEAFRARAEAASGKWGPKLQREFLSAAKDMIRARLEPSAKDESGVELAVELLCLRSDLLPKEASVADILPPTISRPLQARMEAALFRGEISKRPPSAPRPPRSV